MKHTKSVKLKHLIIGAVLFVIVCMALSFKTFNMAVGVNEDLIKSISFQYSNPAKGYATTTDEATIKEIYAFFSSMWLLWKPINTEVSGYYVLVTLTADEDKTVKFYPVTPMKIKGTNYFIIKGALDTIDIDRLFNMI